MNSQDLIHILCRLKHYGGDFETIESAFVYEFSERKYEVKIKRIKRIKGRLLSFEIQDAGEVLSEKN